MSVTRHPLFAAGDRRGRSIPVDPQAIVRLTGCLEPIRARGDAIARTFYERLFAWFPDLRARFPPDLSEHHAALVALLVLVIDLGQDPAGTDVAIRDLGRRHDRFGFRAEHYPVFRSLLVESLRRHLAESWSPPLEREWATTLELASRLMLEGAAESPRPAG